MARIFPASKRVPVVPSSTIDRLRACIARSTAGPLADDITTSKCVAMGALPWYAGVTYVASNVRRHVVAGAKAHAGQVVDAQEPTDVALIVSEIGVDEINLSNPPWAIKEAWS